MIMRCIYYMLLYLSYVYSMNVVLPTIYWDPVNPLFACEVTVRVKQDDILNFKCPDSNVPYIKPISEFHEKLQENAYFLGTNEDMYNACNATGGRQLLYCNYKKDEKSVEQFSLVFRRYSPSKQDLVFDSGKTYYIIGTGFRNASNLDQLINGSCNTIDGVGIKRYRLRLKIYICTPEEISSNMCDECSHSGCYYKHCAENCTDWKSIGIVEQSSNISSLCVSQELQICSNPLLSLNNEYKFREVIVSCPTSIPFSEPTSKSVSTSLLSEGTERTEPSESTERTEPSEPTAARQVLAKSNGTIMYIMLVISSLISLVIGIGCGAFGFKNIYRKKFAAIGLSNKICYKANPGAGIDNCGFMK